MPSKGFTMRFRALAIFATLGAFSANAREPWGGYGLGAEGCGTYVEQRRVPDKAYDNFMVSWFFGFVSAYNYWAAPQVEGEVDQDTVLAYLDKYCRDAPLASVSAGALELAKTLSKRRSSP